MKQKVISSFIVFTLIVIFNQILFHIDIKNQSYDAEVINKAGRQRMRSQQITKMALYADEVKNSSFYYFDMKTLGEIIVDFKEVNAFLEYMNTTHYKHEILDSLQTQNKVYFDKIVASSDYILKNQDDAAAFKSFLIAIKSNEADFLKTMNTIVAEYQKISEKKLHRLEKLQFFFNAISLLLLFYILFTIIIPLLKVPRIRARFN
jgi:nitrate/nitrite-specific signal transduction histidine kinase